MAIVDPDVRILRALLAANGGFVKGSELEELLSVSRVAVWGRLEKLREAGYEIEAQRHQGYRLIGEPKILHETLLRAWLPDEGISLAYFENVDSTNSEAERLLALNERAPFVVVAGSQGQGRGRMGRVWHSPVGANLYASFAFRPTVAPHEMPMITLWLGLAVAKVLNENYQLPVKIKWPNDLIFNGKKVAGMLTEARVDADRTRDLVFGLGLNMGAEPKDWPDTVRSVATSLQAESEERLPIAQMAAKIIETVLLEFGRFEKGDIGVDLLSRWNRYDLLKGQVIETLYRGQRVSGVASGIDEFGRLLLVKSDGSMLALNSGEVSLGTRGH